MPFKMHDRVKLREDSPFRDGEPWEDRDGEVVAVLDEFDPPRLNVSYDHGPFLWTALASEFVPAEGSR